MFRKRITRMDRKCIKLRMNIEYQSIYLVQKLLDTQMFIVKWSIWMLKYMQYNILGSGTWIIWQIICVEATFFNVLNYDSFVWISKTSEIFFTYMVLLYSIFNCPHPLTNVSYLYNLHMLQFILTFTLHSPPHLSKKENVASTFENIKHSYTFNPTNIYSEVFKLS